MALNIALCCIMAIFGILIVLAIEKVDQRTKDEANGIVRVFEPEEELPKDGGMIFIGPAGPALF